MATFTQSLMMASQRYAKAMYGVRDIRKAASVTCCKIGGRKTYTVEIIVPGFAKSVWSDRAWDAYEAKHKAWRAFMAKNPPRSRPLADVVARLPSDIDDLCRKLAEVL